MAQVFMAALWSGRANKIFIRESITANAFRAIWDWPISYADLEPHYTEAERLYGVAGRGEDDFAPLQRPAAGYPGEPLPLHPLNQRLMAANRVHGLHPFRLPLAIDSSRCLHAAFARAISAPQAPAAPRLNC